MDDDSELCRVWQSAPVKDLGPLLDRLNQVNRFHRRVNVASFAAGWSMAALALLSEILGWTNSHYLLPGAGLVFMTHAVWQYRRDRQRLASRFVLEPRQVILFTMDRVRAGLWLARLIYLVVPASFASGMAIALMGAQPDSLADVDLLLVSVLVCLLVIGFSVRAGIRLATYRQGQLHALASELAALDSSQEPGDHA